ncbi:Putative aminoglycoside phosphotransferase [Zhongshania aliphaticivorans]|uniref:Aminoglycoside phosphotransferase n=1 Tax=Zhongshania aliphaticivorans TaxID=1470434 RepID=A0A5S9NJX3_9GAMM|nr:phosphotransferase family protein [Zhongshania aliphaticivorans]CAA0090215.1 Putative aminoglycoside phosphotransferase [Zhongshania aliphaticivorans]CAA0097603.1 Putative aminoglycoside phosphotransferase [Zhongshania aliphaticivorans]
MADAFDLDVVSLTAYLEANIAGFKGPLSAEKFAGGQSNPTYLIDAASGKYVLRRKPPGELLKSAHAVDREFRVMQALASSDVPVPAMRVLCDDDSVIGSMFYVMDFLDGRIMWDAALPEQSPSERAAIYDAMNKVLADLHNVDVEKVGLSDYGKPGNYFERQLSRWTKQYRASETAVMPAMEKLIEWLNTNLPTDDGLVCINHGDFRLDNMMFAHDRSEVLALLDWELSTLGHPYADLAYQCMQLRIPSDAVIPGLGGVDRELLGIPSEQTYVKQYCERRGIAKIDHWVFYLAFSFFRLSAILQGVYKRALDGNASSQKAMDYGALAEPLAELGVALIEHGE